MQHIALITFLSFTAALVGAQVTFNHTINSFTCPFKGGSFCAGASLSTNIIIRCTGTVGHPGNCDDKYDCTIPNNHSEAAINTIGSLAGIPPMGVKSFAPCYEPSMSSGHAACSYNNIAYPDTGSAFPIPGSSSSSTASASATTPFANSSSTSTIPAKISAGINHMPYASPFANLNISIPAGATPPVSGIAKQYAPNPGFNDISPSKPSVAYTNVVGTSLASASHAVFTGGAGKVRAGAGVMGVGVWVAIAVLT